MNGRSPDRRHASGAFLAAVLGVRMWRCKTPATPANTGADSGSRNHQTSSRSR